MSEHFSDGPRDEVQPQQGQSFQQPPPLPQQQPAPQRAQEPPTPQQQVVFDLDKVQAEKRGERARAQPFTTRVAGRVITFSNPKGLDWQDLMNLGDEPGEFVELCIEDEDERNHVMRQRIDSDVMEALIGAFTTFYGIGDQGRGGRGNRLASRR